MPTRRQILTGATAVTSAALLGQGFPAIAETLRSAPPTGDSTAETIHTPATLARRMRVGRATVPAELPIEYVGLRFDAPVDRAGAIRFHSKNGPGAWQALHLSHHGRDGAPDQPATELLRATPNATGFQLDLPNGVSDAQVVTINTTAGPNQSRFAVPYTTLPGYHKPAGTKFYTRAGWGADESLRFGPNGENLFSDEFYPVQALTVHHTAVSVDADRKAAVRGIYRYQAVDEKFGDIGYHLLIDPEGNVYEGRHSGEELFPIFDGVPIRGFNPKAVTAAHVQGFNSGNIGICLLGDFTSVNPTAAALETLVRILTALCKLCSIDPTANITYVNPANGTTRAAVALQRHRDWAETECPGNMFAQNFDHIRDRVAAALSGRRI